MARQSLDSLFDKAAPSSVTRRQLIVGAVAAAVVPSQVFASAHPGCYPKLRVHLKQGTRKAAPQDIRTTCLDPRHIGMRSIAGGDVCAPTAAHALATEIEAGSVYTGLLTSSAIMGALADIVGGAENVHKHTDAASLTKGMSVKDVDGCLFCSMWRKYPRKFDMSERQRDELHASLLELPCDSHVYTGEVKPFAFLTVHQLGYKPGDCAWGVDGTIELDGMRQQLYVDHQTLGEAHLANYAKRLWRCERGLASRMSEEKCVESIVGIWKQQTETIIRIKRAHHVNIPHATVTFMPDGTFHRLHLAA